MILKTPEANDQPIKYTSTARFADILSESDCLILVATEAGLIRISVDQDGQLDTVNAFRRPVTAVGIGPGVIVIVEPSNVWTYRCVSVIAETGSPKEKTLYFPDSNRFTGPIDVQDIGIDGDRILLASSRFSAIGQLKDSYSFQPTWLPDCVSSFGPDEQCFLNSVAEAGDHRYASLFSPTSKPRGWVRDLNRGEIIDCQTNRIIAGDLVTPVSLRYDEGHLYFLSYLQGALYSLSIEQARVQRLAAFPGFAKGLDLTDDYAFAGVSPSPWLSSQFSRDEHLPTQPVCGIAIVDRSTGEQLAVLQFLQGVTEIRDVKVYSGTTEMHIGDATSIPWRFPQIDELADESPRLFDNLIQPQAKQRNSRQIEYGLWLQESGKLHQAAQLFSQLIAQDVNDAAAWNNLGNVHQELGNRDKACDAYKKAIEVDPKMVPALRNLGILQKEEGLLENGLTTLKAAQELEPSPVVQMLIATSLPPVYQSTEEIITYRNRLKSNLQEMVANKVQIDLTHNVASTMFYLAYQGANDREIQELVSQIYQAPQPVLQRCKQRNRIRIGFISRYFRNHTIGRLNSGIIERLPVEDFEVFTLSVGQHHDEFANHLRSCSEHHIDLPTNLQAIRSRIVSLDLDVLYFTDVGMDAITYSLSFSRLAPVQVASWGHPMTTGSPHIDYFISSELLETENAQEHYTEKLIRLPTINSFYYRPKEAKKIRLDRFGLNPDGNTYLCFQNLFKIHPDFDQALAQIIERDPQAQVVFMEGRYSHWTEYLKSRFHKSIGAIDDKIVFLPSQSHDDFMSLNRAAKVSLDPFHFGGGNTSFEAFSVGLPVVTLPSEYLKCRITSALYKQMGIPGAVASSVESYVEIALKLANDPEFRESVSDSILANSHQIYENAAVIKSLGNAISDFVNSSR